MAEVLKDSDRIDGLFTLYRDRKTGALRMALTADELEKTYLYFTYTENGVPAAGQFRGAFGMSRADVFRVSRYYDRIEFIVENTSYYFDESKAIARAADANVSHAVAATEKIEAEDAGARPRRHQRQQPVSDRGAPSRDAVARPEQEAARSLLARQAQRREVADPRGAQLPEQHRRHRRVRLRQRAAVCRRRRRGHGPALREHHGAALVDCGAGRPVRAALRRSARGLLHGRGHRFELDGDRTVSRRHPPLEARQEGSHRGHLGARRAHRLLDREHDADGAAAHHRGRGVALERSVRERGLSQRRRGADAARRRGVGRGRPALQRHPLGLVTEPAVRRLRPELLRSAHGPDSRRRHHARAPRDQQQRARGAGVRRRERCKRRALARRRRRHALLRQLVRAPRDAVRQRGARGARREHGREAALARGVHLLPRAARDRSHARLEPQLPLEPSAFARRDLRSRANLRHGAPRLGHGLSGGAVRAAGQDTRAVLDDAAGPLRPLGADVRLLAGARGRSRRACAARHDPRALDGARSSRSATMPTICALPAKPSTHAP